MSKERTDKEPRKKLGGALKPGLGWDSSHYSFKGELVHFDQAPALRSKGSLDWILSNVPSNSQQIPAIKTRILLSNLGF